MVSLPQYIKEKREEFRSKFGYTGHGNAYFIVEGVEVPVIDFLEQALTELVDKAEEGVKPEVMSRKNATGGEYISKMYGWNACLAEISHNFAGFKSGEEHTGV